MNWLFGINTEQNNIKYFLGGDTLRSVGDVWTVADTTNDIEDTYGFDKFEGSSISKTVYTFNKIKEKGGDIIAVVKNKVLFETRGIGTTWDKTVDLTQAGEFKCKLTFNITKGIIIKNLINGALTMSGKDLGDDSSWNAVINVALKQKGKLK